MIVTENLVKTFDGKKIILNGINEKIEKNEKVVSKSIDKQLAEIQENAMIDITKPLQNMFDEMASFVTEAFV